MVDISEVAENIYLIDNQLYSVPRWGGIYLINEEKKALIDSGPTSSASNVLEGIKSAGVRPEDIDYLIVTHIHLDHAGGAGVLIRNMPRAQLLVHHRGFKHMVNPEKLVSSVIEVQGKEATERNGEVAPVEAERVKPVYDADTLRLGERQLLQFIDAPGHAPHAICIYESRNSGVFTGDTAGIYIAENEILVPNTVPPSFDAGLYINTIQKLMELKATKLYFAHFGVSSKVQELLRLNIDKLQAWDDMVSEAIKENDFDGVVSRMIAQRYAEIEPVKGKESLYKQLAGIVDLGAAGYIKYRQEKIKAEQVV